MIITCEACSTSFNLDDQMIKSTGSKVRCSVCANVFTAFPRPADDQAAPAASVQVATPGDPDDRAIESIISETDLSPVEKGLGHEQNDSAATLLASLDDDDLDLDISIADSDEAGNATILADLEDDLDLSLDSESDGSATILADLDQDDFDLDASQAPSGTLTDKATVLAEMDDDALDLDFSMEVDPDGHSPAAGDPELALSLDDADAGQTRPADSLPVFEDDLDLSGLEGLLKDDEDAEHGSTATAPDEQKDTALALEPDDGAAGGGADADDLENSLEAIELDLENGAGPDSPDGDAGDTDDANIDLSEIEKMLEEPKAGAASTFSSVPDQDLDLDIEASLETERWMTDAGGNDQLIKDEQLDLSELEQVLDDFDGDAPEEGADDRELELDLSEDQAPAVSGGTADEDDELAFNLTDFEDQSAEKARPVPEESQEPEEMSLEFEVAGDGQDRGRDETASTGKPRAAPEPATETPRRPSAEPPIAAPVTPMRMEPATKGMSKSLLFILIVVLLGGAGYGTYYLLNHYNVEIPFLSDYLKPTVDDPGNIKMSTTDINSRFVDNANVGKLFVITGKVKNGYPDSRGMIALLGKIFSTGKVLVQEEKVYAGNIMSDLELANLQWDAIQARLSNRLGDNRSNVKIEPGNSIPFMVVFSGLPDDLEEFTIEVIESTSLK